MVTPEGVAPRAIHIRDGTITAVTSFGEVASGARVVEGGDAAVLPGLVDSHVHINEPGRTDWEGFLTATRAAAAGGVTTLIEMPLNAVPPTTTAAGLEAKLATVRGKLTVDVGFWGGIVPGNGAEIEPLWRSGVYGFKCFLVPSGVDEFAPVGEAELRQVLPVLARLGAPLLVHAELPGPIERATVALRPGTGRRYADWLASRPPEAELGAIELVIRLAREYRARVHIVHLSTARAIPAIRSARRDGVAISVETCPHYLHFAAEDVPDGACALKCAPPIRERSNREELWGAVGNGELDLVASDHSPCPPELKQLDSGDFFGAWGGIASLQIGLPVVWTGCSRRGMGLETVARLMAAGPARLAGLANKGRIATGCDADLVIFRPEAQFEVEEGRLFHRHHLTPYAGARLNGVVERTWLGGELVFDSGEFPGGPRGQVLRRN